MATRTAKWCIENNACSNFKVYDNENQEIVAMFKTGDIRFIAIKYADGSTTTIPTGTKLELK